MSVRYLHLYHCEMDNVESTQILLYLLNNLITTGIFVISFVISFFKVVTFVHIYTFPHMHKKIVISTVYTMILVTENSA